MFIFLEHAFILLTKVLYEKMIVFHASVEMTPCFENAILGPPWQSSGEDFTFQFTRHRFDPWSGSYDPTCLSTPNTPKHKAEAQFK